MMEMYVLKSAACLFLFFGFYKLFLEKESFHFFKRFYLLGAIIASFSIPAIVFTTYIEIPINEVSHQVKYSSNRVVTENPSLIQQFLPSLLWIIYSIGMLFFGIRFILNISKLYSKIRKNTLQKNNNFINVLLNLPTIPHTFFYYIFLNKDSFQKKEIPQEVIWHEETHARQLHSLDILFLEILQILFWFNPLLFFIKKSMKLNHEFLADQSVINKGVNTTAYQKILLAFSSNAYVPELANAINYSFIKKRFTVMKTHTSKRGLWLRTLLILPLVTITLYSFSTKEIIEKPIENEFVSSVKASKEEIKTYNNLATIYNKQPEESRVIPLSDLKILETIYRKMTPQQKEDAVKFPNCPPSEKTITIKVNGNKVIVNDKVSSVNSFAKDLDAITKKWKKKDFENVALDVFINNPDKGFLDKLEAQYKKTQLYKNDGNKDGLFPPPPPKPDGKNVFIEKEIEEVKTPGREKNVFIEKEIEEIDAPTIEEEIEYYNEFLGPETPTPPPTPGTELPPPPPPPNPVKHMKELAKEGAKFYFEGKEIKVSDAINIIEKSNDINIEVKKTNNKIPIVKLSKEPIVIED